MPPRVDTETEPLLPSPATDSQYVINETKPVFEPAVAKSRIARRPILLINLLFVLNGLGYFISVAPQTQLFENIICDAYYRSGALHTASKQQNPSRDPCKVPAVQEALATIFGFQTFFDGIPGLLLAMPYGVAADKIGRKPVLLLSMAGQFLAATWVLFVAWNNLSLRLAWLSSAFTLIGGGSTVTVAVCMMIVADSTSEEDRSRLFFVLQGSFVLMEIIGPPLGSILMANNVWTPLLLGLISTGLSTLVVVLVPETLPIKDQPVSSNSSVPDLLKSWNGPLETIRVWTNHCRKTLQSVLCDTKVAFLILAFFVADFGRQSLSLLLQYVSERYNWPIADASYLLSFRAGAQMVHFLFVLPAIDSWLLHRAWWPAKVKDLWLAKISICLLTMSFVAFAFAPRVWVIALGLSLYTLGTGFNTFARSLVSVLVEPTMIGTLYTMISVMDTLGSLSAGPLVAEAFKWGMHLGGIWHGLPYMLSFAFCSLGSVVMYRIHLGGDFGLLTRDAWLPVSQDDAPINA
ncbi:hypothetical protein D0864_04220 [Hortaea werneckii]|uniref:Major facilitator superfamily (MFS) profile domain-containing protein n=1 Tax=Hortaea werneckii TaxID=91943 RepID=A0A3M7GCN3_HORWE|nr:hypothetical protein D0864_04220 [Hortaea werneckii]RMZ01549.1 hypothetical protein D0862_06328 [Hortaea werneckii]